MLGVILINKLFAKKIFKHLFSERTNLHAGSLSYLTILALIPTLIITMSIFNLLSRYIPLLEHPYFEKINIILNFLNLKDFSSIVINILCINLLSSGIYSLLTTFEDLYRFKFENYFRKKLYSIALSFIIVFIIVVGFSISFAIETYSFLENIDFFIDFLVIFVSLLSFYKLSTFQKLKSIYIGSTITSFFLTIFLHFFYYIMNNYSKISTYYGSLTPVMIGFLLVYYSCYIIYLGIIVNYEIKKISLIKTIKA